MCNYIFSWLVFYCTQKKMLKSFHAQVVKAGVQLKTALFNTCTGNKTRKSSAYVEFNSSIPKNLVELYTGICTLFMTGKRSAWWSTHLITFYCKALYAIWKRGAVTAIVSMSSTVSMTTMKNVDLNSRCEFHFIWSPSSISLFNSKFILKVFSWWLNFVLPDRILENSSFQVSFRSSAATTRHIHSPFPIHRIKQSKHHYFQKSYLNLNTSIVFNRWGYLCSFLKMNIFYTAVFTDCKLSMFSWVLLILLNCTFDLISFQICMVDRLNPKTLQGTTPEALTHTCPVSFSFCFQA